MENCTSPVNVTANSITAHRTCKAYRFAGRRAQSGQSAVIALLVMLLLAFAGALFVTIVARNLVNANRQNRAETAEYYADAGIHFADDQLTNSDLGADWRPVPLPQTKTDPNYPSANDPDFAYLTASPHPFTRYNMGNGRFLLRVTYMPAASTGTATSGATVNDPLAGYIKIESVGRQGVVDSQDPTTFTQTATRQNATLVAYKAIGITQYGLFITNIDKRSDIASIGVPSKYDSNTSNPNPTLPSDPDDPSTQMMVQSPTIITPATFDFNNQLNYVSTELQQEVSYQPYPITTQLGAPDAYLVTGSAGSYQLQPNPNAGKYPVHVHPDGTWWDVINGTDTNQVAPGGGTMRSNSSTRFFGLNKVYLNSSGFSSYYEAYQAAAKLTQNGIPGCVLDEHMEVAGDILLDNYSTTFRSGKNAGSARSLDQQDAALLINPFPASFGPEPVGLEYTSPSTATTGPTPPYAVVNPTTAFDSKGGAVRDGEAGNDEFDYPREVKRVDPPVIDSVNASTGLTRYRDMAINSPSRNSSWTIPNAGQYGFGQIIYVDNKTDLQTESNIPGAGYSLTDEWLNRNQGSGNANKNRWNGPLYTPPGVEITIGDMRPYGFVPNSTSGAGASKSAYGVYLLRHDVDSSGNAITWKNPNPTTPNTVQDSGSPGLMVTYDELGASNQLPSSTTTTTSPPPSNPNNDVIIVCEGNVRVRGCVSADDSDNTDTAFPADKYPRHITIVTYGTAYIEGNLLRGNPDSSIAVLAHDYVCVNTTQFTAGHQIQNEPAGFTPPGTSTDSDGLEFGANQGLSEEFSFGLTNGATPAGYTNNLPSGAANTLPNSDLALYMDAAPAGAGTAVMDLSLYNPRVNLSNSAPNGAQFLWQPTFGSGASATTTATNPTKITKLIGGTNGQYNELLNGAVATNQLDALVESEPLHLWLTKDPASGNDPVLSRVAVLPMDIRIEAVLYAQTRSFFVIPGDWLNSQSGDDLGAYSTTGKGNPYAERYGMDNTQVDQARFPFYGQPMDLKITIYGAVSEAHPADIGAQSEWMKKWGWIPQYHGSLNGLTYNGGPSTPNVEYSGHMNPDWSTTNPVPGIGLSIVYDAQCGLPVSVQPNGNMLRTDAYGNPLPFAPRLPVCPGLLYAGQAPQLPSQ